MELEKKHKVVREYTIPEALRSVDGSTPKKVGLVQLTAEQELLASKIGRLEYVRSQYAAAKLSIVEFDGKPIDNNGGDLDVFWERADARLRSLLLNAYNRLASPSGEDESSFFDSEVTRV